MLSLTDIRPLYFLPVDPFVNEVLIPGFRAADTVDCMVGFFSSAVLATLAPGLAVYIRQTNSCFRLIVSPFLTDQDRAAIEEGTHSAEGVAAARFAELAITEDVLQQHTLRCLSYLLRTDRIEIRIALMKSALFHPKVWIFGRQRHVMAAHGSSNCTDAGILRNFEQITISRAWEDPNQKYIVDKLERQFAQLWANQETDCVVVAIPEAAEKDLIRRYPAEEPPTENELRALYDRAFTSTSESPRECSPIPRRRFEIPDTLRFEDGPFCHQGDAVRAWCAAGYRGVLEMATGSGKTITAMICARRLYEAEKPLLVVVAAPYIPLIQQWSDEISPFGLRPVDLTTAAGASGRARELSRIRRRFRNGASDVEAVVVSHRTLCNETFKAELAQIACSSLLVADEVHHLGSEGFTENPPEFFRHRLGLSATPVRQYDDEGTAAMFSFFGPIVFQFTLAQAIGNCLVPYDYYVHPVKLTRDEMDEWYELTARIKANAWRSDKGKPDEYLSKLLRDRRALLETAQRKIAALEAVLEREDHRKLRHTLIYASDKGPQQLDAVNEVLRARGVLFHQLTCEETANRDDASRIIRSFQEGTLRVLTAKRVLDEGVNLPQIGKAFILASTTVERQWVQRRGRLLRTCRETGKTHSEIHDFIAVPPNLQDMDDEARALIQSELLRVQEFARLARNAGREGGPLQTIHALVSAAFM